MFIIDELPKDLDPSIKTVYELEILRSEYWHLKGYCVRRLYLHDSIAINTHKELSNNDSLHYYYFENLEHVKEFLFEIFDNDLILRAAANSKKCDDYEPERL